jgi:hypothetical protein
MNPYLLAIEESMEAVQKDKARIQEFVQSYGKRASTLVEAAGTVDGEEPVINEIAGLKDAVELLSSVGRKHIWLLRAVVGTLCES